MKWTSPTPFEALDGPIRAAETGMATRQDSGRRALITLALGLCTGCLSPGSIAEVPPETIEHTLFLIGDAGEPDPRAERSGIPLDSLTSHVMPIAHRSTVVFLGDNIYPPGIAEPGSAETADAQRRMTAQVRAIPSGARGIFVAGNHDWATEAPFGLYAIRLQEQMIASVAAGRNVRLLPMNGCPGPETLDVGRMRLILLDTQWWLHTYNVRDSATACTNSVGGVTSELRQAVRTPGAGRVVVVAAHHPLMTGGEHGGYCGVTGPFRRLAGRSQDILSTSNKRMRDSIENAFSGSPPLIFAAGHDHSLQVLRGGRNVRYVLVSGAGSPTKVSCAVRLRESLFSSQHRTGFMRVDILRSRGVLLRVYRYSSSGSGGLAWTGWLERRS